MAAFRAHGTTLSINAATINDVRSITFGGVVAETVDVTTMDSTSGWREFINTLKDAGTFTAEIVYDPADSSHQGLVTLLAGDPQTAVAFVITMPNSGNDTIQGNCFVTNYAPSLDNEAAGMVSFEFRITGAPTFPS